jgi:hypothetical protein
MYMVMLILYNPDHVDDILKTWDSIGIRGATIMASTGIRRLRRKKLPKHCLLQIPGLIGEKNITLFVIAENKQKVEDCLHANQQIEPNLYGSDTGVFAAWPLALVLGVPPYDQEG